MKYSILILLIGIFLYMPITFGENISGGWSYSSNFIHIDSILMSEDGKYISVGVYDHTVDKLFYIYLFDNNGKIIWTYKENYYCPFTMTPNGRYIVVGDKNNIYLFENNNKSVRMVFSYNLGKYISSIFITPDGKYILAVDNSSNIYFLNQKNGLLWHKNISDKINSISLISDGKYIFIKCKNKNYLFDREGNLVWNTTKISYVSTNGSYVFSVDYNNKTVLKVYNISNKKLLWSYILGNNEYTVFANTTWVTNWYDIDSIKTSSDDKYIIVIYDIISGEEPEILPSSSGILVFDNKGKLLWENHTYSGNVITAFSMTPDGKYIVIGTGSPPPSSAYGGKVSAKVLLYNNNGSLLWSYEENYIAGKVKLVYITPDGKYILAWYNNGDIFIFNNKGDILWHYKFRELSNGILYGGLVNDVYMSSDGKYVVIKLWNGINYFYTNIGDTNNNKNTIDLYIIYAILLIICLVFVGLTKNYLIK
ncbi:WD40 repeat domain-containing protein [Methanocaldococcus sp.]